MSLSRGQDICIFSGKRSPFYYKYRGIGAFNQQVAVSYPPMFSQLQRCIIVLAGLAVGVGAIVALNRPMPKASNAHRDGCSALVAVESEIAARPVAASQAASSSQKSQTVSTPASVHQILPRLEQTITDWREFQPKRITIAPYADLALEFEMTSVRQEDGRTIWRGRNALNGAFLVTVATQNEWHAVLEIPAASGFEFHISGQSASVSEKNAAVLCGSDRLTAAADMATKTVDVSARSTAGDGSKSEQGVNTVDVLFFYDAGTFSANGSNAQKIETTIAAAVESTNVVLQNSAVENLRWHYVAAYQVPTYTATDKLQDDLNLITSTDNAVGKFVAEKCALHGVDQAVLYVSAKRGDNYDGLAWVPNSEGSVAHNSALVWNSGYIVLAHEMAHNFGCHHDRKTDGAAGDDGKFSYGFSFTLKGVSTGTVMSYAPVRVPFFSNPDLEYSGVRLGVADDQAGAADNSRVLRTNAQLMSAYRDAAEVPIITAQPQSATVSPGVGFTLSVSAVGSSLTFQWRKDGIDLPGSNQAVYAKSSASSADDGVYNVVVSNDVGQAASASASVAVSATASASMAATGGSGGGGGAVEPWVLTALGILGSLRLFGRACRNR
jgi:hypothetical protein